MSEDRRQIWIRGSCPPQDLAALTRLVLAPNAADVHAFACIKPSMDGLNMWPALHMNVVGRLATPDVDIATLAHQAGTLLATAPGLLLTIDVGGPDRDPTCEATILAGDGVIEIREPQIHELRAISRHEYLARIELILLHQLEGGLGS